MDALYKNTHPDYAAYLYLMAPISLAILNPLSFILMEIEKRRRPASQRLMSINSDETEQAANNSIKEQLKIIASVAKNIFLNPIIMMTILGILGNVIFKHQIPNYLGRILEVIPHKRIITLRKLDSINFRLWVRRFQQVPYFCWV